MPRCLAAALFAAIVLVAAVPPASAASFDCGRASTALENAVCEDSKLSALDEQMSQNYLGLLRRISGRTESTIRSEQKTWLKRRNACGSDERCIAGEYRARIARIADLAAGQGLVVEPKRTARATAPAATDTTPRTSIFAKQPARTATTDATPAQPIRTAAERAWSPTPAPGTFATTDAKPTQTVRTTAERASSPGPARRVSVRPDGTVDEPETKSPGLFKRLFSKVAPNLVNRDPQPVATPTAFDTPPALREEPQTRVARRDDGGRRNVSVLPNEEPIYDEPVRKKIKVAKPEPIATPEPAIEEDAPVALAPPQEPHAKRKHAKDDAEAGAPAVLLYTTPDVSRVIRLPDGESPFDKLDAQHAFEEPPPAPAPTLKATPERLSQPSKRAFDSGRFDAFNDPPNG